jgi:NTP pyrophosphatase (non-canonical NTP hydrolase)
MMIQELAKVQLAGHGIDRYPTISAQFNKLVEEIGELAKAVNQNNLDRIKAEAADVALALAHLCSKFDFVLDYAVADLVTLDRRDFREATDVSMP